MQPFFTSNDSDIPRLEGLYIKERNPPAALQGAPLNNTAILGTAVRGPVGRTVEVDSPARFKEVFGDRDLGLGGGIYSGLWKALLNKPFGILLVNRVAAAAAVAATAQDAATTAGIIEVLASSPGVWGNNVSVTVNVPSTDGVSGRFDLVVSWNDTTQNFLNLDFTSTNDNSLQVLGNDDANLVTITKLKAGTPATGTFSLGTGPSGTLGSDGTVADSDYVAALAMAAVAKDTGGNGAGCVLVAEYMSTAVKSEIQTLSSTVSDRIFLACPNSQTVSTTSAATEVAGFTRSDRIVYCFNHAYTLDPATATEVLTQPTAWMAAILSQIDVDIHPGEEDTKPFLSGITRLYNEGYQRGDYIALKAAGICGLERDNGFDFVSGVTTSLTSGKTEITRRRMADFLQISMAKGLKSQVKKKNTLSRRKAIIGLVDGFLGGLKDAERVVEQYLVDDDILNTPTSRGLGIERLLIRVRLISHILELVLETEIGTQVMITEQ